MQAQWEFLLWYLRPVRTEVSTVSSSHEPHNGHDDNDDDGDAKQQPPIDNNSIDDDNEEVYAKKYQRKTCQIIFGTNTDPVKIHPGSVSPRRRTMVSNSASPCHCHTRAANLLPLLQLPLRIHLGEKDPPQCRQNIWGCTIHLPLLTK